MFQLVAPSSASRIVNVNFIPLMETYEVGGSHQFFGSQSKLTFPITSGWVDGNHLPPHQVS